ncbi:hypothetical protein M422DRAFT_50132 [Sphaerobolus stellatus SS14]|uniref:Uncharacterized protein n=1 Tax=Sphaerobolus stellatus (strain SS14) TaxID=990650 RepID=A0A0C9UT74_SPHS4|nr:hypothetical protein M422DRAFT_50132 [Sphaerobolus stellatus SS14]
MIHNGITIQQFMDIYTTTWSVPNTIPSVFSLEVLSVTLQGVAQFLPEGSTALHAIIDFNVKQAACDEILSLSVLQKILVMVSKAQSYRGIAIQSIINLDRNGEDPPSHILFGNLGLRRAQTWVFQECQRLCAARSTWLAVEAFEACCKLAGTPSDEISQVIFTSVWGLITLPSDVSVTGNTLLVGMYLFKAVMEGSPLPRELHPAVIELLRGWFQEVTHMNSQQFPDVELRHPRPSMNPVVDIDMIATEVVKTMFGSATMAQDSEINVARNNYNTSATQIDPRTTKFISQLFSETLKNLLDREGSLIVDSLATPHQVQYFKEGKSFGPTISDFKIDWMGEMKKGWNLRAARVFSKHLMDTVVPSYLSTSFPEKLLHIDALTGKFQRLLPRILRTKMLEEIRREENDKMEVDVDVKSDDSRKQQKRRHDRKNKLYRSRCEKIMANMECPNAFWNIVFELGPDGMSSDESEEEEAGARPTRSRRKFMFWRNAALDPILAYIDLLSKEGPHGTFASSTRGSPERIRLREMFKNSRSPVKRGLPLNLYSRTWLQNSQTIPLLEARPPIVLPVFPGQTEHI